MKVKLRDKVGLKKDSSIISKTLADWIKEDPKLVYLHVYRPDKTGLPSLSLDKEAYTTLKETLNN